VSDAHSAAPDRFGVRLQIGHAGTLDPQATGLLIICIGKGCKKVSAACHSTFSMRLPCFHALVTKSMVDCAVGTHSEQLVTQVCHALVAGLPHGAAALSQPVLAPAMETLLTWQCHVSTAGGQLCGDGQGVQRYTAAGRGDALLRRRDRGTGSATCMSQSRDQELSLP